MGVKSGIVCWMLMTCTLRKVKAILRSQFVEMHKFADPTAVYNQDWCQRDAFVIRLPEMYFIAAEAMLQTNKQEAVDLMNEFLMKRAIPGKENDMKITESELTIDFYFR